MKTFSHLSAALLLLGLTAIPVHADETYAQAVEADQPVAWYRFGDDGETVKDSSGVGNDGKVVGDFAVDPDGPVLAGEADNAAGRLEGGYVDLGTNLDLALDRKPAITMEAWFKAPLPIETRDHRPLIVLPVHLDVVGATLALTKIGVDNVAVGGRSIRFDDYQFASGQARIRDDEWNHIVGIVDYQHGELRAYVNGVPVIIGAKAKFNSQQFSTYKAEKSSGAVIGFNPAMKEHFAGSLDEVAVYDYALDDPDGDGDTRDSRVAAHAESGPR